MFVRRNKELAQTVCILILLATIGYSIFLYNSLQVKLQNSETKNVKLESQHASLSNQLQKIYADHARAQGLYEIEKQEHIKTKQDLENSEKAHKEEVEKINMKHFEDKNQLKSEYAELRQNKEEAEVKLRQSENEVDELKSNNQLVEKNHKINILKIQSEEQARSDALNNLEKQYKELTAMNEQYQNSNQLLLSKLDFYQNETQYYTNLKNVLVNLGVDVLDLKNTRLLSLSPSDRSLLFSHFGSDDEQVQLVQRNRLKAEQIEEQRKQALEDQRLAKEARDKELKIRAQNILNNNSVMAANITQTVGIEQANDTDSPKVATNEEPIINQKPIINQEPIINQKPIINREPDKESNVKFSDSEGEKQYLEVDADDEEEEARKELEAQNKSMQLQSNEQDTVIEKIKRLQSEQQKIAEYQQENLLKLAGNQEFIKGKNSDYEFKEQKKQGKYDEEEDKVQLNGPPVVPLVNGDNRIGQGFIERPEAAEEKEEINESDEDNYNYHDEDDDREYENDDDKDINVDPAKDDVDDNGQNKVWEPQEAGKAAFVERQKLNREM